MLWGAVGNVLQSRGNKGSNNDMWHLYYLQRTHHLLELGFMVPWVQLLLQVNTAKDQWNIVEVQDIVQIQMVEVKNMVEI